MCVFIAIYWKLYFICILTCAICHQTATSDLRRHPVNWTTARFTGRKDKHGNIEVCLIPVADQTNRTTQHCLLPRTLTRLLVNSTVWPWSARKRQRGGAATASSAGATQIVCTLFVWAVCHQAVNTWPKECDSLPTWRTWEWSRLGVSCNTSGWINLLWILLAFECRGIHLSIYLVAQFQMSCWRNSAVNNMARGQEPDVSPSSCK